MELGFFMKGFFLGVSIAAPVGPIGLLCISNTLRGGAKLGLASGLGAAAADALYAGIGAWGLTLLAERLTKYNSWLHLGGGVFLLYLGWRIFSSSQGKNWPKQPSDSRWKTLAATFFLTLTNPLTIFSFSAVFAGSGLATAGESAAAVEIVLGVFCGSICWWILLTTAVSFMRHGLGANALKTLQHGAGLSIAGFGLWSLWTLLVR